MAVSTEMVKELRERTHAGMMDCKRALEQSDGDMVKAVEYLRMKGLAIAAKKAERVAAEGTIVGGQSNDGRFWALVEVNCETDFVVGTDDFQAFSKKVAEEVMKHRITDLDKVLALDIGGKTVADYQTELIAKIGENIRIRRLGVMEAGDGEKIAKYIHAGSKIGVLVLFDDPGSRLSDQLGKEVAMHVAAMSPFYVSKGDIPASFIDNERKIFTEQLSGEKKPPEIMEKIVQGKLNKYLSELCLEDQVFVKDLEGKASVKNTLKKVGPEIKIKRFIRLVVGEGVARDVEA